MEFQETLLAAQRNQQEKSSAQSSYYKARFDPPKKEQKQKDRLSANIQKFLAKKDEEERRKQLESQRKREELLAMRDPKALRKIQKTLKTIKSANKSVIEDAIDHDNTAVTLQGPEQPDQDDYGYESQENAVFYAKMMQKYSKIPDEPKFPTSRSSVKKDLNSTRERVKHALQHEDDPVPHKRKRRTENEERELSPPPQQKESDKKKDEKPKFRKPAPPPMDFNQLLKLAEQKKSQPIEVAVKKTVKTEPEPDRLMTKKQKKEYEEEMARRQRRQERIEAEKSGKKPQKEDRSTEKDRKPEGSRSSGTSFGRIPKVGDKANSKPELSKYTDKERDRQDRERLEKLQKEKERLREKEREFERDIAERERIRLDREKLEKLKAERERIDREMERLNKDKERLEKTKTKLETKAVDRAKTEKVVRSEHASKDLGKKSIDLKSHNTYRIDKNANEKQSRGDSRHMNGNTLGKPVPKGVPQKDGKDALLGKQKLDDRSNKRPLEKAKAPQAGSSKSVGMTNSFDFDKHVSSLGKNGGRQPRPSEGKRRPDDRKKPQRRLESDSEYDSEMDDFIDNEDENMDYSAHIKQIFGYDKNKYRHLDDEDDPNMESSFVQVQREEFISKKQGLLEDLEDMRMEALEKQKKAKKKRLISD